MPAALVPVAVHPVSDGLYGCEKKRKWMGGRSRKSKLMDWDTLNEFVILAFRGGCHLTPLLSLNSQIPPSLIAKITKTLITAIYPREGRKPKT